MDYLLSREMINPAHLTKSARMVGPDYVCSVIYNIIIKRINNQLQKRVVKTTLHNQVFQRVLANIPNNGCVSCCYIPNVCRVRIDIQTINASSVVVQRHF